MLRSWEGTTKITTVKGLVTDEKLQATQVSLCDKRGNDSADQHADEAYIKFPHHITSFANLYAHSTRAYRELVEVVQLTILRVLEAAQQSRQATAIVAPINAATFVKGVTERPMPLIQMNYPPAR